MSMMMLSHPLRWPETQPRRVSFLRKPSPFTVSPSKAYKEMIDEIERLGGTHVEVTVAVPAKRGRHTSTDDPAVAVWFRRKGRSFVLACDTYRTVNDNIRAIGLTAEMIRGMERHGISGAIDRAMEGFAALPAPEAIDWRTVFVCSPGTRLTVAQIERDYRTLAMTAHPDRGGSELAMARLNAAREAALKEASQ